MLGEGGCGDVGRHVMSRRVEDLDHTGTATERSRSRVTSGEPCHTRSGSPRITGTRDDNDSSTETGILILLYPRTPGSCRPVGSHVPVTQGKGRVTQTDRATGEGRSLRDLTFVVH